MENEELLKKLSENSAKSLKFQKITAFCMIGILAVFVIAAFMVVPPTVAMIAEIHATASAAGDTVEEASSLISELDKTAKELQKTSGNMNDLLTENGDTITESLNKMSQIDFDGLNQGIKDLQDAVGPFADFMNKFR